jgi:hypothetical protein
VVIKSGATLSNCSLSSLPVSHHWHPAALVFPVIDCKWWGTSAALVWCCLFWWRICVTDASAISSAILRELYILRFLSVSSQSWLFRTDLKSLFFWIIVENFPPGRSKVIVFRKLDDGLVDLNCNKVFSLFPVYRYSLLVLRVLFFEGFFFLLVIFLVVFITLCIALIRMQ